MSTADSTKPGHKCTWRTLPVLAGIGCAIAIAGCGSSAHESSVSSHANPFLALSECMHRHGVPNFPDPGAGGINLNSTGINPASPSFEAGQATCSKLLPGGGPGSQPASEQQKEQLLGLSQCMRRHGVTGFPDPTRTPPTSAQGYSIEFGVASDLFLAVPDAINVSSPVFKQAAKACHLS